MKRSAHIAVILVLLVTIPSFAQDSLNIHSVDALFESDGPVSAVAVQYPYAYTGMTSGNFRVFDITDPQDIIPVGRCTVPPRVYDIETDGNYAFVGTLDDHIRVVDISDPASPHEVAVYDFPGTWDQVVAMQLDPEQDILHVCMLGVNYTALDVSDPLNISLIGYTSVNRTYCYDIAVDGDYVYLAAFTDGLIAVDISDQEHPEVVDQINTNGYAYRLACGGGYIWVGNHYGSIVGAPTQDPSNLNLDASYYTGFSAIMGLVWHDDMLIPSSSEATMFLDVSEPASLLELSTYEPDFITNRWHVYNDSMAVVESYRDGIHIVDFGTPSGPVDLGTDNTCGAVYSMVSMGDSLLVCHGGLGNDGPEVTLIDISDPNAPVVCENVGSFFFNMSTRMADNKLLAPRYGDGFEIYEYTNENTLELIFQDTTCYGRSLSMSDTLLACACGDEYTFRLYDMSEPEAPTLLTTHNVSYIAYDVVIQGDYLYVVTTNSMIIFDITDPTAPIEMGSFSANGNFSGVTLADSLAYLVDYSHNGIWALNISDPDNPAYRDYLFNGVDTYYPVLANDNRIIQFDGPGGVKVLDASDPTNLTETGYYVKPGDFTNGVIKNDILYTTDLATLLILDLSATPVETVQEQAVPVAFGLADPWPNPFNSVTRIGFTLPQASTVKLTVVDILGRTVATLLNDDISPGTHHVSWNAVNVASGTYYLRLEAPDGINMRKVVLVK